MHLLEYDSTRGFRCECCGEWTLGGNLYSGKKGNRICFICHLDEVSFDMARKYGFSEEVLGAVVLATSVDEEPEPVNPGAMSQPERIKG